MKLAIDRTELKKLSIADLLAWDKEEKLIEELICEQLPSDVDNDEVEYIIDEYANEIGIAIGEEIADRFNKCFKFV